MDIKKNHIFLTSSKYIDDICTPLKSFGILHFTYLKNFNDFGQICLSNHARWVNDYYHLKLFYSSLYEGPPAKYYEGYSFWPEESDHKVLLHGRVYFDSGNGITLTKQLFDGCEFYFFSGSCGNKKLRNFYLNNLDVLWNFTVYFKEKAAKLIEISNKSKIFIPNHYKEGLAINNSELNIDPALENLRQHFFSTVEIDPNGYKTRINNSIKLKFTKRELDCIALLLQGKSIKEIAEALLISPRTVEVYIDNLKNKLVCRTKSELLIKLLALK